MSVKIVLNNDKILKKVNSDTFGKFVSNEWKRLINQYTPHKYGFLQSNVDILPFALHYKQNYANYQYNGVSKNGNPLNYTKDPNPAATDHWDEKAAQSGQLEKLYRIINNR